ncbi:MAG: hypothetical protein GF364_22675 [Candidatus Lokiarchaeota archaeon]|nr:hypothetical protein [Candidatus Lokiarchaeota archaeon]
MSLPRLVAVMGGGDAAVTRSYATILEEDYGADEVWPLVDIASGTTIHAHVNSNRDGTLTGWDLQNAAGPVPGTSAPYSDGANDCGNIYTSNGSDELADIFDPAEGSFLAWAKVQAASAWTDGESRHILTLGPNSNNRIVLLKNATDNTVIMSYKAGNHADQVVYNPFSSTDWFYIGMSWSVADDEVRAYLNGSQVGGTQTGLGTWAGDLTNALIGAYFSTTAIWHGLLAYAAVKFGSVWTPTQFSEMHAAAATAGAD